MPTESKHNKATRSEHRVLPEMETMVSVQTIPRAVCFLYHDQAKDQRMQLDADEEGIVRFHVKASKESQPVEMLLECSGDDGKKRIHIISLQGGPHPGAPASPPAAPAGSAGGGKLHPPLAGDPLALSNEELVRLGYPRRPDPVKSPARYARWHRLVSRPFTRVNPRRVAHPGVSFAKSQASKAPSPESPTLPLPPPRLPPKLFSPTLPLPPPAARAMFNANFNIWSGAYLTNPVAQFFWIQADWKVPGVAYFPGAPLYSAAAEWVGLDNSGTDLYQSGTDSECYYFPFFGGWTFTNYWMWIELLPFAPWAVTNFPISPGDAISVDIFVADQNGNTWFQNGENGGLTPADNSVWFMLYNNTKGLSYWGTLPTAPDSLGGVSSTGFTGTTAEFILERPTVNGSPAALAFFGLAAMTGCYYGDSEYGDRSWTLGPNGSTPFDATLTYINMTDTATNNLLAFPISVPDPTTSGGYEILWLWTNYL